MKNLDNYLVKKNIYIYIYIYGNKQSMKDSTNDLVLKS